jgi:Serine protease inhibitor
MKKIFTTVLFGIAFGSAQLFSQNVSIAKEANDFAFNLFAKLNEEHTGENIAISPFETYSTLAMLYVIYDNKATSELEKVLNVETSKEIFTKKIFAANKIVKDINADFEKMRQEGIAELKNQIKEYLEHEKSGDFDKLLAENIPIWNLDMPMHFHAKTILRMSEKLQVDERTKKLISENFGADFAHVDFTNKANAAAQINKWIEGNCNFSDEQGFDVSQLISEATKIAALSYSELTLRWRNPYFGEPNDTENADFFLQDGGKISAPMMSSKVSGISLGVMEYDNFKITIIPYFGDRLILRIILPNENISIKDALTSYQSGVQANTINALATTSLPRFNIAPKSVRLNDALMSLGLKNFIRQEFAEMLQRTEFSVDEIGTSVKSLGATFTTFGLTPDHFSIDRPFVFMIEDTASGIIWYMGQIYDPSKN